MAPHSSTLAWKFPLMEKPGRLPSMGSLEEWDTAERLHFHFSLSCIGEGNSNPLQCSCLENPRDGAAWWAAIHGVAQSQKLLKRLSSSIDETKHNSSKHPQVSLRNISKFLLFIVVTKIICNCHSFPRLVSQWFIFNCDFFDWRIIALQYCVGLRHASTWISHRYTPVPFFLKPPPHSHPSRPLDCHRALGWAVYARFHLNWTGCQMTFISIPQRKCICFLLLPQRARVLEMRHEC